MNTCDLDPNPLEGFIAAVAEAFGLDAGTLLSEEGEKERELERWKNELFQVPFVFPPIVVRRRHHWLFANGEWEPTTATRPTPMPFRLYDEPANKLPKGGTAVAKKPPVAPPRRECRPDPKPKSPFRFPPRPVPKDVPEPPRVHAAPDPKPWPKPQPPAWMRARSF